MKLKPTLLALFALAALPFAAKPVAAQNAPQYALRQYLSVRGAASPTLSPDGKQIAFLTSLTGTAQVWQVGANGGWPNQLTFFGSSVNTLEHAPASNDLLVVADDNGNEQFQFTLVSGDGTTQTPLTASPKVRHEWGGWASDGKTIFYAANDRDPRYFDCYLMDIATRQSRRVFQQDSVLAASALSHDGKTLIATEAVSNVDNRVYIVDVATGQGRMVTPHTGDARYNVIGFASDDKTVFLTSDQGRDFVNLAALDTATGKITFLQDEPHDVDTARLSPDGKRLVYTLNRDGYEELNLWDTQTRKPVRLPALPKGIVTPGNFTRDGKQLAVALNTPAHNSDVYRLDLTKNTATQVTFSSTGGIAPSSFITPTLIRYKTFDGKEIPALLYLPTNAPQGQSLPVILSVHGGPEAQEKPNFSSLYQYFVSRGYALLAPNIRGSDGYGKTYLALDNGPKRWDALKDLNAAVDWVGTQNGLDAKKVTIFGGSYGGFAVLAMLTHYPDRFAAGVDLFGIADFKAFLANTAPYRRPLRIAEYGDPTADSDFLDAISPGHHAEQIKAPLLVIQGHNDPRVPQSESEGIVNKVRGRGGVAEFVLFPDEGHGIAKLPNRITAYEAVVAFLDKYVRKTAVQTGQVSR